MHVPSLRLFSCWKYELHRIFPAGVAFFVSVVLKFIHFNTKLRKSNLEFKLVNILWALTDISVQCYCSRYLNKICEKRSNGRIKYQLILFINIAIQFCGWNLRWNKDTPAIAISTNVSVEHAIKYDWYMRIHIYESLNDMC